jgi:hypothetical protein
VLSIPCLKTWQSFLWGSCVCVWVFPCCLLVRSLISTQFTSIFSVFRALEDPSEHAPRSFFDRGEFFEVVDFLMENGIGTALLTALTSRLSADKLRQNDYWPSIKYYALRIISFLCGTKLDPSRGVFFFWLYALLLWFLSVRVRESVSHTATHTACLLVLLIFSGSSWRTCSHNTSAL